MNSNEIRRAFVEYFREHGHLNVPSSSLVPHNDPTVLLTTAGMQQMTPYFLGLDRPPSARMTSIQKCFRTVDIDEVGDESHLTFFEMLGNFSVGDYFKAEAITWAWELLTNGFGIAPDRWYPTVHHDDQFSYQYWRDSVRVPEAKIRKLGDDDNWWGPVGTTGPNGPDSEIYYDRGAESGCGRPDCGPTCEHCSRFLEVWNLVFMEFFKEADGTQRPLPRQNIDTGMGLERISMILQGKNSVFETDLYLPILERAADIAGVRYRESAQVDRSLRVIADHGRAVTFLIADGVFPGNEGRSYVLRRVLRRAVRHGRIMGLEKPFLTDIANVVIEMFHPHYAELAHARERILDVIAHEEENFGRTLATGISRFETLARELKSRGETQIPGAEAFRLYDTYGFPYELTEELATDEGLAVDREGFERSMAGQREMSRAAAGRFATEGREKSLYGLLSDQPTRFLGYTQTAADATVVGLFGIEAALESAEAGEHLELVLDQTPFYGESGGQVGDIGTIETPTGVFVVNDTQKPTPNVIVHIGTVQQGFIRLGQTARATVDGARRAEIQRNHTATHLLHAALHAVVGEHARQAGSLVAPERLRFDFTSMEPVRPEQLRKIQELVNDEILKAEPVVAEITSFQAATSEGAMALFGEKYGDIVRMVTVPGFSKELCGGTHVERTAEIGLFLITEESSIASGIRRIEAITGHAAAERALRLFETSQRLARVLHVPADAVVDQVAQLAERVRLQDREIEQLRVEVASVGLADLAQQAAMIGGVSTLVARVEAPGRDALLQMGDRLRDRLGTGVIVLGAVIDDRPVLIAMVTRDLVSRGLDAGKLIRVVAPVLGGRGGGRPELAQGGGTDAGQLDTALEAARTAIEQQLAE